MTCIVSVVEDGTVWMGGDSFAHYGAESGDVHISSDPKVQIVGPCIVGIAGPSIVKDILRTQKWPKKTRKSAFDYLWSEFVPRLRKECERRGLIENKGGGETVPMQMLVGLHGELFNVDSGFNVGVVTRGYDSVGMHAVALGALWATRNAKLPPAVRIEIALNAEVEHSALVRGPFHILSLPREA